jgi:signal transduction histidine kinase
MERTLQRVAAGLSVVLMAAGLLVLAGWQYRIPLLKGEVLGTFIAPSTGLCFLLCGISILLQLPHWSVLGWAGRVVGILVAVFATATFSEHLFRIDLHIDRIVFAHRLSDWNLPLPGRFAVNTAVGFTFAGLSLCALRRKKGLALAEFFAGMVGLVFYLSIIGYLYAVAQLYGRVMALPTALLFAVLGVALACGASRHPILDIVLSSYAGGMAARRMVLAIVVLMPLIGFVGLWAHSLAGAPLEVRTALGDLVAVAVFTILALHTASVMNDVDKKRRETEAALMRSEKLSAAGRMAATVAHEINNPLEAISNLVYLLQRGDLPDDTRWEYLKLTEQELDRVAAIARRTLGFYKDQSSPSEINVRELVEAVLDVYRARLEQKNIVVGRMFSQDGYLLASRGELQQVLANLVANAIDALPSQGGRLDISVGTAGDALTIAVTDNGHGIADQDLGRIFEPFFSTKKEVGTGLGLWVSLDLVRKNGGAIEVMSSTREQDHGTTFRIAFPAAASQPAPAQPRSAADGAQLSLEGNAARTGR